MRGDSLFRATIQYVDVWSESKHKRKLLKPLYVVASDKADAVTKINNHLNSDYKVKNVSRLASQMSGILFSANC